MNLWVISDSGWVSSSEALVGAATAAAFFSAVTTMVETSVPSVPVAVWPLGAVSSASAVVAAANVRAVLHSSFVKICIVRSLGVWLQAAARDRL